MTNKRIHEHAKMHSLVLRFDFVDLFAARDHRHVSPTRTSSSVLVHTRLIWTLARVRRNIPHARLLAVQS